MRRTASILTIATMVLSVTSLPSIAFTQAATVTASSTIAVAPQYDTTHVYVAPAKVDAFVASFLGTFGGTSTKQVVTTVTPTPSLTSSQLLQTPVGTVSAFGFRTPIPTPFGSERTGYLVTDMNAAIEKAKATGAAVVVTPFPDPIGLDAVIQWPGGVMTQIYWHTTKPSYAPFVTVPENRVYVSPDDVEKFMRSFLAFSGGRVVSDETAAPGAEIGLPEITFRRLRVASNFGKMTIFVTDRRLPFPHGSETTGYEVADLDSTLKKATSLGAKLLVPSTPIENRISAIVQFPGGYIAEIHSVAP
ncbi:hypothetical protein [Terracidiphilus gabretensis]|jgi:predicted enzyme related to lactoylglutathione lyase|uniref:hypothetical protein n=1 Tax=Terracidiphilus gabretensis TaxID=1577687 RepID=UPI00071B2071|nr:hypothetical protein [Terracidiphilus gabretensis]